MIHPDQGGVLCGDEDDMSSVGGTNYSYDDNGNLTNDETISYYYDCE
jgi:hypothetical protein